MTFIKQITAAVWLVVPAGAVSAATWHADREAGVHVRIPWSEALVKNASQVEGLILHSGTVAIAPGQRYTSAVYAPGGEPFFVIWTRPDAAPPTQRALLDLAGEDAAFGLQRLQIEARRLRGAGWLATPAEEALRARVAFVIGKEATVFLGYYFSKPEDASAFDALAASLELEPDRQLRWSELPRGGPGLSEILATLAGLFAIGLTAAFVAALQRKPRPLPAEAAAAAAPSVAPPQEQRS